MNAPSLAAALQRISSDRQRTLVHQRMFLVWSALAIGLIVYILGSRAFGWNSPFFVPACVLIGVGAWFAVRASVARVKIDLLDIAREVESGDARLNSLLLAAYEEQNNAGPEGLSYIQERVILEALEANRRSPWGQQVAEKRYFKGVYHAIGAGAFVLIAGMAVLVGPRGSALGLLLGGIEVTPGTAQIEKGTALAVMAKFPEPAPNEVKLVIVPKTGPIRTVAMDRALQDPVFGASFPEVTEDFAYTVEYRGRKTAEYQVSVFEYPTLRRADAKLTYPEFTGLGEKKIDDTRRVSAVEGTVVDYRLELNKPVKNATLTTKTGQSIPLTKDAKFDNVYHLKIDLAESLKLSLALKDEAGRTNKLIQELALEALPNREPDLKIVFPRGDQRVSAIEEVSLQAEIRDDFGLGEYGLAYSLGGEAPKYIKVGAKASANEKKALAHLLRVEEMGAQTDQLVSYFAWAEDRGPDGKIRRSESDMYFAEIRPFEEIFRKGPDQPQQQQQEGQQGGPQSPGEQLAELQKNIINATWKLQRTERGPKPSPKFKEDVTIVRDSQKKALSQAETLIEKMTDPRTKALGEAAATEMRKAVDQLGEAASSKSVAPLPGALGAERAAYQALLRLQAKEYAVSRQRNQQGGGGGAQQRAQRALDELDIPEEKNRYETQSQAASPKNAAQQEQMQTLNRLKELSRRQSDINEKLQELQAALQEAKTDAEKEELLRRLKRLREEQQDAVQDMDDLQQKMAQSQNNPAEMADARQQLEKAREQAQKASEQMSEKSLGQANAAGARTEKDLKKLTEDFRKATAQQFNDEMRDMRRDARDLSEKQKEIAEKMEELKNPKQRTLSDAGGKDELARQLSQQKTNYANILERMKKVSEEAESNEPLLSQKLYDTVRDLNQKDTAPTLDKASEFLKRSFVPQASQLEQKARQDIEQLKRGVDEAAGRLLGDETDALRTAARELDELTRRVRNEAPGARGTNATSQTAAGPGGRDTNSVAGFSTNRVSTNQMAGLGSDARPGQTNSLNRGNGEGQSDRLAQNLRERTRGNRPGQPGERGQGSRQQESQPAAESPEGQAQNQGQNQGPGQGQQRGESQQAGAGENPRFFERAAAGQNTNQAGSGAQSGQEGPFTGGDFRNWADRLRDVQEMIDEPDLRNDVAQILDRARNVRSEFLRHAKTPEWNAVDQNIVKPLTEVRQRIAEELARRDSSTVAPLDRDPVPARYGELVSRYYQSLGQGAPGEKKPPTTLAPR
jgi:hypothetical protein